MRRPGARSMAVVVAGLVAWSAWFVARSTFVVDRDGLLRWSQVGDRQMVRDGTEMLRILDLMAQLRAR